MRVANQPDGAHALVTEGVTLAGDGGRDILALSVELPAPTQLGLLREHFYFVSGDAVPVGTLSALVFVRVGINAV